MWENITFGDIEQAKHTLNLRRAETLSRHAEELKALEDEQSKVDELAAAIEAFVSKYGNTATPANTSGSNTPEPAHSAGTVNVNFDLDEIGSRTSSRYGTANFRAFG